MKGNPEFSYKVVLRIIIIIHIVTRRENFSFFPQFAWGRCGMMTHGSNKSKDFVHNEIYVCLMMFAEISG